MMASSARNAKIRFNYSDYLRLPEDKRYELIEGDLHRTPSPTTIHQRISRKLELFLAQYVENNNLGEVFYAPMDVVLSDEDVVQPDILYVSRERMGIIRPENIRGAPDLVVEILSPASLERDSVIKKKLYARHAVREYWIVNPEEKTVEVLSWATLHSPLLPGFSVSLRQIF